MADTIACPECGTEIEVTEVLSTQLRQQLRREFEADAKLKEEQLKAREIALKAEQAKLTTDRESLDQEVASQLAKEREKLAADAKKKARAEMAVELQGTQDELDETKNQLQAAKKAELELRRERSKLEDEKASLELDVQRRLDEERGKIRDTAKQEADKAHQLKEAEQEQLVSRLKTQVTELQRKLEQGSQELQGEALELDLEDSLRRQFVYDEITPVKRGQAGSDVIQKVRDNSGFECGVILWESKRTQRWNDNWLTKLKDDQRAASADLAVIVSTELPKDLKTFREMEGIWVTGRDCALPLAAALRAGLIELAKVHQAHEGRQGKMELLHRYLCSRGFKLRMEGIIEAFRTLSQELEKEKTAYRNIWARREKQLQRVIDNTAGMYGDLSGLMGTALPAIEMLELPVVADVPQITEETGDSVAEHDGEADGFMASPLPR